MSGRDRVPRERNTFGMAQGYDERRMSGCGEVCEWDSAPFQIPVQRM